MSGWKDAILNFILVIVLTQVLRFFDAENPSVLNGIRLMYVTANGIVYGILYYCYLQIQKRGNQKELSYNENPPAYSDAAPVTIITTYEEYDKAELIKFVRTSLISMAISVLIHYRMGYVQPIFIQSILPLKNIFNNPLVKIYLLNHPEVNELKRPFNVQSNPFSPATTSPTTNKKKNKIKKK
ncbi:hypothetical protein K502DRAFT_362128 [Neoconidiobolus thromboides FSU 785]|nr:hypothetical protein K502DRAFT_362128 [Neoconidiobolus thromboides FSU 785]